MVFGQDLRGEKRTEAKCNETLELLIRGFELLDSPSRCSLPLIPRRTSESPSRLVIQPKLTLAPSKQIYSIASMTGRLSEISTLTVGPGKCPLVDILFSGVTLYMHYKSIFPPQFAPPEAVQKVGDGDRLQHYLPDYTNLPGMLMYLSVRAGPQSAALIGLLLIGWKTSPPLYRKVFWIANGLDLLGAALRLYCYRTLGKYFTFELAVHDGQKVIKKGPYGLVRHPSYTGAVLTAIGSVTIGSIANPLILSSKFIFPSAILGTWLGVFQARMVAIRVKDEEKLLKKELGKEYEDYMKEVPYKFLPYIW